MMAGFSCLICKNAEALPELEAVGIYACGKCVDQAIDDALLDLISAGVVDADERRIEPAIADLMREIVRNRLKGAEADPPDDPWADRVDDPGEGDC